MKKYSSYGQAVQQTRIKLSIFFQLKLKTVQNCS